MYHLPKYFQSKETKYTHFFSSENAETIPEWLYVTPTSHP
jgi:hypothetical protein